MEWFWNLDDDADRMPAKKLLMILISGENRALLKRRNRNIRVQRIVKKHPELEEQIRVASTKYGWPEEN